MNTICNYRFNNQNRGAIKLLLITTKSGKQDEKHKIKPLS
jgi:hypothetical protein